CRRRRVEAWWRLGRSGTLTFFSVGHGPTSAWRAGGREAMPMALPEVALDGKYGLDRGPVFLTGVQALLRRQLTHRGRNLALGRNARCFSSGYRGSPLGTYDQQLWRAGKLLKQHHVHFQPGVNEELAATAVWGSQQTNLFDGATHDGVFGIWYGKGPGVDRSGDVFKHANFAGSSPWGGVLAIAGDDHVAKS